MRYLKELLSHSEVKEIHILGKPSAYFKRLIKESKQEVKISSTMNGSLTTGIIKQKDEYNFTLKDKSPTNSELRLTINRKTLDKTKLSLELLNPTTKDLRYIRTFAFSNRPFYEEILLE